VHGLYFEPKLRVGLRVVAPCSSSYTNTKLISNTDTLTSWLEGGTTGGVGGVQDWNNLKGERSLFSQDISQRMVISDVLDLPVGHGKKISVECERSCQQGRLWMGTRWRKHPPRRFPD
jgi:hypothetical protein